MEQLLFNIERAFKAAPEELEALRTAFTPLHLEKNECFLQAGRPCTHLAVLTKGCMRLFYDSPEKESCNNFFFENAIVGSLAGFISGLPSMVTIVAIDPCDLQILSKDQIQDLTRKYPSLKSMADVVLKEHLIWAEKREASLLRDSPEDRFRSLLEEHPKIFKRVPLHYIASYLGITPETLSRYRSRYRV